ncbi:hypothetical protein EVAR_68531_1 [Eumeta japonica]|uniref:Uncharacterized protein n=1 Tax=Eumeta variegata TaxID=151549 RepID=A0A4C1SPT8_EUMVA|nr:hypothetical protein EVAR_68531_1 [Eumeta japonica]
MGGAWGRLVRPIKTALAAKLIERSLHEEVFHTLLLEAEHIVHSRPLTEMDIEPTETEGLTPNHFLIGHSCDATSTTTCSLGLQTGERVNVTSGRWLKEYLPTLVRRRASRRILRSSRRPTRVLITKSVWWTSRRLGRSTVSYFEDVVLVPSETAAAPCTEPDVPSINCSGIGASVAAVFRPPLVKLVLQYTSLSIETLSIILLTHRKNPYSETTVKENPICGLRRRYRNRRYTSP